MKTTNNMGPITHPWGILLSTYSYADRQLVIHHYTLLTVCQESVYPVQDFAIDSICCYLSMESLVQYRIKCLAKIEIYHWLGHQSQAFQSTILRLWVVGSYMTSRGQGHVGNHIIIDFRSLMYQVITYYWLHDFSYYWGQTYWSVITSTWSTAFLIYWCDVSNFSSGGKWPLTEWFKEDNT